MQNTLKQLLVDCLHDGRNDKVEMDPLKYPSQILSLAEAVLASAIQTCNLNILTYSPSIFFCPCVYPQLILLQSYNKAEENCTLRGI